MASGVTILVLGYVVRGPLGGMAWSDLHYLLGLRALGHDVWFLEDSDDYPSCVDPVRRTIGTDPGHGLRFASELFDRTGLGERWAYHDAHTGTWHGPGAAGVRAAASRAELLLNLAGVNPIRPWLAEIPCRALVDKDPVFTQLRHVTDATAAARAAQHTHFFTFAENVGGEALLPADGLDWQPTRHPLWLPAWPATPPPGDGSFTTVMQWESYPAREHDGVRYGLKSDSFGEVLDLPRRVDATLELVLGGPAPLDLLRRHGWRTVDPLVAVPDPWAYRRYLRGSAAELTVAKQAYVESGSGWFSERSASYLACGRPVVTQDTGFTTWLPAGEGVLTFASADAAVAAIESVRCEPERHGAAARALAEEHFDSRRVLESLVERSLARAPQPTRAGAA